MELFFTPLHVIVAAGAGFLVGVFWYSPLLFLRAWLSAEGVSLQSASKRTILYIAQTHLYSFIAHVALTSVLAVLFDILAVTSFTVALSLGLLLTFGFCITVLFVQMVYTPTGNHYDKKAQIKFLVSAGHYLVTIGVISSVLFMITS
jgi:nitrate reductase NapE component